MAKVDSKDWRNLPVSDWNVLTFTEYLRAKHEEVFGIPYVPFQGWRREQGMIGNVIGTKTKPRQYDNYLLKNFVDKAFESYTPTADYPGTSFGFSWTYRQNVWQQVMAEDVANEKYKKAIESHMPYDDIEDLL